jgi:hypothetical protein
MIDRRSPPGANPSSWPTIEPPSVPAQGCEDPVPRWQAVTVCSSSHFDAAIACTVMAGRDPAIGRCMVVMEQMAGSLAGHDGRSARVEPKRELLDGMGHLLGQLVSIAASSALPHLGRRAGYDACSRPASRLS